MSDSFSSSWTSSEHKAKEPEIEERQSWVDRHVKLIQIASAICLYLYFMILIFSMIASFHGLTLIDNEDKEDRKWGDDLIMGSLITLTVLNFLGFTYNTYVLVKRCDTKEYTGWFANTILLYYWTVVCLVVSIGSITAWVYYVTRKRPDITAMHIMVITLHIIAISGMISFYKLWTFRCCDNVNFSIGECCCKPAVSDEEIPDPITDPSLEPEEMDTFLLNMRIIGWIYFVKLVLFCISYFTSFVGGVSSHCQKHGQQDLQGWLISWGVLGVIHSIFAVISIKDWNKLTIVHGISKVLYLVMSSMFIVGNVWIYRYGGHNGCDPIVYKFTWWLITSYWCAIALFILLISIVPDITKAYWINHQGLKIRAILGVIIRIIFFMVYIACVTVGVADKYCDRHSIKNPKGWLICYGVVGLILIGSSRWGRYELMMKTGPHSYRNINDGTAIITSISFTILIFLFFWLGVGFFWTNNIGEGYCARWLLIFGRVIVPVHGCMLVGAALLWMRDVKYEQELNEQTQS